MIIQILLAIILIVVLIYALTQRHRASLPAALMSIFALVGIVFVFFPDHANNIANTLGVGRGADLILYCFVVLTLVAVFNIHLKLRAEHEALTELARAVALLSVGSPERRP